MENAISQIGDKCFGCAACVQSCPQNAITMEYNAEGFLYPVIDEVKCVGCGCCLKSCPASGKAFAPETNMPQCFAAFSNDDNAMQSSSGGVFSILAECILDSGGFVCGAAFDRNWLVVHKIISNKSELAELKTSKYLQSDTKRVYSEINELLNDNKSVLFSGTPCQVAGLYGFLGKDYDNLLTIDMFCHGAPSPMVWEAYLREITNSGDIESVNFRDKTQIASWGGGSRYNTTICWTRRLSLDDKGEKMKNIFSEHHNDNIFMRGFLQNLYLRKSCAVCKLAKTPRLSDISLGDFWGYDHLDKNRDTSKGISAVLLNTPKGERFFAEIKSKLQFLHSVPLASVVRGNPVLKEPCKTHENRAVFMSDFANLGNSKISDLIGKHLGDRDVGVMNFAPFSVDNYGAVLIAYAMEHAIAKLGYNASTINFVPKHMLFAATGDSVFTRFRKKFLNLTGICMDKSELCKQINSQFDRLCIGSDQIVRAEWHSDFIYYLDWVNGKKTLLSYAASFGMPNLNMNAVERAYAKKCVDRFDAFSVREHSGADIMKREFDKDCPVVCDPTMLLDADDYQQIIDAEAIVPLPSEYVAYYFLHEKSGILSGLVAKYPIIDAYKAEGGNYRSVGDWLNIIKNAKYVVTDSFHGSAFSIIYHKQFIVLPTESRGNERLKTLMSFLEQDRFITASKAITEELFAKQIDYNKVIAPLMKMKADGYNYLVRALAIKPNNKMHIINEEVVQWIKILDLLAVLKIRCKKNKIYVRLFGFIPLIKIKNNKIYLFEFLQIAKIRNA